MKDKFTGNQNIENMLKSKMNQLSESVNCFDKISERAFPQENQEITEDEISVSGLEIITGKPRRRSVFLKAAALTAAAVLCIVFIPRTGAIQNLMTDIANKTANEPDAILLDISDMINDGSYRTFDVPLEYYVSNDILVTPLFSCPFGESDEKLNVRLYIRQFEGFDTNQVYAFAYSGEFSEKNIVAAALPEYTFSEEELSSLKSIDPDMLHYAPMAEAVGRNFSINSDNTYADANGEFVSIASFEKPMYYKDSRGITIINSNIIYGHNMDHDSYSYFYDMLTFDSSGNEFVLPDRSSVWKKLVFSDDTELSPQEGQSMFTPRTLFLSDNQSIEECLAVYIGQNYQLADNTENQDHDPNGIAILTENGDKFLCSVFIPYDHADKSLTALYIPTITYKTIIEKGDTLTLTDGNDFSCEIDNIAEFEYSSPREETIKSLFELLEKEKKLRYEEFEKEAYSEVIKGLS